MPAFKPAICWRSCSCAARTEPPYRPAVQSLQAVVDRLSASTLPPAHTVHAFAPPRASVFVAYPAPHAPHAVAPVAAAYVPGVHAAHTVRPANAPKLPGAHAKHAVSEALSWSTRPAGHALQAVAPAERSVSVAPPAAHGTQALAPGQAAKRPAEHALQDVPPADAAWRPRVQLVQAVEELPSASMLPGAQRTQALSDASMALPAPHTAHTLAPAKRARRPAAQPPHAERPVAPAKRPAEHLAQAVVEALSWSMVPAAHAVQALAPAPRSASVALPAPHSAQALAPIRA